MFTVELHAGIRSAVMVDGLNRREAAKRFGVHRNTITNASVFSSAGLSAARAANVEEVYGMDRQGP
jgi:transposase